MLPQPLCAVLIPTRKRLQRLRETIWSIQKSCTDPSRIEACLRIDDDDTETIHAIPELLRYMPRVRVMIGPRNGGYVSLCDFYMELAAFSNAQWIFILNDDITLEGKGWDDELAAIPVQGHHVMAASLQNGGSLYNVPGAAYVCPIVPNNCWKQFGHERFANTVDDWFDIECRKHGWQRTFLNTLTVNHQRDNDSMLAYHRQMTS